MAIGADPSKLDELSDMGINLFSVGNNHSLDYGRKGVEQTISALEQRQKTFAGIGRNRPAARKPRYLLTDSGRVGLVHTTTSYGPNAPAGDPAPELPGKSGISPLHVYWTYNLPPERLNQLKEIAELVGIEDIKEDFWTVRENWNEFEDLYPFMHMGFREVAEESEAGIRLSLDESDRKAVLNQVEESNDQARWTIVTIHSHQCANGSRNNRTTPDFLVEFAHDCIKMGADAFVCTGPHVLRGIEIFEGKPIFYSLGNFLFQIKTQELLSAESFNRSGINDKSRPSKVMDNRPSIRRPGYWKSVIPTARFGQSGELRSIVLLPISLATNPRHRRGTPKVPSGTERTEILEHIAEISASFGTNISIRDGLGFIRPDSEKN
jgi:poly-gamma-glutamate synthesis protein (capsule biosynthesis protein)